MMGSTLVPASIATIAPFFPFAFLLVIIEYISPRDRAELGASKYSKIRGRVSQNESILENVLYNSLPQLENQIFITFWI